MRRPWPFKVKRRRRPSLLVWLVNPFDPIPGEEEQLRRYAYLAASLREAGHRVVWWSSDFSHRFKRPVDKTAVERAAKALGIVVRLIPTPPYPRNLAPQRLWSHRVLARRFLAAATAESERPDVILASSPPLELAASATRLARDWRIPSVVDIQDQWPDNFMHAVPAAPRWFMRAALQPLYRLERGAYRNASAVVGVARGYVERGLAVGGTKKHHAVFHLGADSRELQRLMSSGASRYAGKWAKEPGEIRFIYSGSFTTSYDLYTILSAAKHICLRHGTKIRFVLAGAGVLAPEIKAHVEREGLTNVCLPGFLGPAEHAYLLSQCDVGFNASFPEAMIYFPNKIFFYLAAGMAVLNTIPGECADFVTESGCGLNYTAGDVTSCAAAIERMIESPQERQSMRAAALAVARTRFERDLVYRSFVRFLETVGAEGRVGGRPSADTVSLPGA
jgi:glycosyltransferase involved in cell wall biosynthesis